MINQSRIKFGKSGNYESELFVDISKTPYCLIVVAYGVDGLIDKPYGKWAAMICGYAESLAELGFAVMIPYFIEATKIKPGADAMASIPDFKNKWQSVLDEAIDHRESLTVTHKSKVGLLGFSLGGHLCLRMRSKSSAIVSYFAPEFPELDGIGLCSTKPHALLHHGEADGLVDYSNALAIQKTLTAEHTIVKLSSYLGATHGFPDAENDTPATRKANNEARNDSNVETLRFFSQYL